ncbi:hypothetical protein O6H91_Y249300 [Diphasiastrum complanatum]|nr:hypothetical protein O6H91_Y249300 [Diphasiastrum complanatum]
MFLKTCQKDSSVFGGALGRMSQLLDENSGNIEEPYGFIEILARYFIVISITLFLAKSSTMAVGHYMPDKPTGLMGILPSCDWKPWKLLSKPGNGWLLHWVMAIKYSPGTVTYR